MLAVTAFLARLLSQRRLRYSYRFVWAAAVVGSLAWLSRNPDAVRRIRHRLVLTGFGDPGSFSYKRSRRGDALIDRIVSFALGNRDPQARLDDFSVYGYDERQFFSPSFNLPVGRLNRTPYGEYPKYHTSDDNLGFIDPDRLDESLGVLPNIVDAIEAGDRRYRNTCPYGESRLGKRSLFRTLGGEGLSRGGSAALGPQSLGWRACGRRHRRAFKVGFHNPDDTDRRTASLRPADGD